jgi:tetratricopeptide (TPR) repeat protein
MKAPLTPEDRLLRKLLVHSEPAGGAPVSTPHPDEEMLALFAVGALAADQRTPIIEHLADCATCRQTVSQLLSLVEPETTAAAPQVTAAKTSSASFWQTRNWVWMAVAASLLLAVGLLVNQKANRRLVAESHTYDAAAKMLADRQFDQARQLLASSATSGIDSDRLRSLEAQAVREIPDPLALAYAGRLTDFGYDALAGPVTKEFGPNPDEVAKQNIAAGPMISGAGQARDLLNRAGADDIDALLNRGHALLSLGEAASATADFERGTQLAPKQALAWLGLGLAYFMQDKYHEAEAAFREAVGLDPNNFSAAVNLAMALQQLGKTQDALAVWKQQLQRPLSPADRQLAEQAVKRLGKP